MGTDFFPQVDAGQMRLHVRAPPGTRLERRRSDFASVERAIRQLVGNDQIDVMLDNIGLPYSGINIALSDSATVGPMDGEILISLKEKHTPTAELIAELRRELPQRFPAAAVLLPAGRHRRSGAELRPARARSTSASPARTATATYALAAQARARPDAACPGVVDSHVFQVPDAPALTVDVDRALATRGRPDAAATAANNVLVATNSSAQIAPNFWVDPAQQRQLSAGGADADLSHRLGPGPADDAGDDAATVRSQAQLLMNVATFGREHACRW